MQIEHLVPRETIAARLAMVIREYILQFRAGFEPGERIDIQELATEFDVSTTPVKEALKRLEANGLVEVRARRGVFVCILSQRDVEEIVTIRAALEQLAVRLCGGHVAPEHLAALERSYAACEALITVGNMDEYRRADMDFHRLLVEVGNNKRLVALYQVLLEQSQAALAFTPRTPQNIWDSLQEHRQLLDVLRAGDLDVIEAEIVAHWERSKARIVAGYAAYLREAREQG